MKRLNVVRACAGAALLALASSNLVGRMHASALSAAEGRAAHYQPITWPDEVSGKNFRCWPSSTRTRRRAAVTSSPELRAMLEAKRAAVAQATVV